MPKPKKGARLGGSPAHQRLILSNLATALFEHGRITTTETKARMLRPVAEKLITKAKRGDLHNRREVLKTIRDKSVVHTLFTEIAPTFAERPGGYTRITKIGPRKGDNAPMAVIELVTEAYSPKAPSTKKVEAPMAAPVEEVPAPEAEAAETEAQNQLEAALKDRRQSVDGVVAIVDANFHAAAQPSIAGLEGVAQAYPVQPGPAVSEILERQGLQGDAVGHLLPSEGLHDAVLAYGVEASTKRRCEFFAFVRAASGVGPTATFSRVPVGDFGTQAVRPDPLGEQLRVGVRLEDLGAIGVEVAPDVDCRNLGVCQGTVGTAQWRS